MLKMLKVSIWEERSLKMAGITVENIKTSPRAVEELALNGYNARASRSTDILSTERYWAG
jgi:hypothetical protein